VNFAKNIFLMIKNFFYIWKQNMKNAIYVERKSLNFITIKIMILLKNILIWPIMLVKKKSVEIKNLLCLIQEKIWLSIIIRFTK